MADYAAAQLVTPKQRSHLAAAPGKSTFTQRYERDREDSYLPRDSGCWSAALDPSVTGRLRSGYGISPCVMLLDPHDGELEAERPQ